MAGVGWGVGERREGGSGGKRESFSSWRRIFLWVLLCVYFASIFFVVNEKFYYLCVTVLLPPFHFLAFATFI